jgi:hypothetical protein
MKIRRFSLAVASVLILLGVCLRAAEVVRVRPLARDGVVLVSFELAEGFTDDVQTAIHAGLPVTFAYDVELRRGVPLWIDRAIAASTVTASVRFDNLTRRHQLSRTLDGRMEPDATVTENEDIVKRWLTTFERLPLFKTTYLEPNAEYYVRVRARTHPRNSLFPWPWSGGASGLSKFTFIP